MWRHLSIVVVALKAVVQSVRSNRWRFNFERARRGGQINFLWKMAMIITITKAPILIICPFPRGLLLTYPLSPPPNYDPYQFIVNGGNLGALGKIMIIGYVLLCPIFNAEIIFRWDNSGCREEGVKWQTALMQLESCSLRGNSCSWRVITDVFDPTRNEEHRILNRGRVTQIYLLNRSCCFYVGFCNSDNRIEKEDIFVEWLKWSMEHMFPYNSRQWQTL